MNPARTDKCQLSLDELEQERMELNRSVVSALKPGQFDAQLHAIAVADASLGRMSHPRSLRDSDVQSSHLSPRPVHQ